MSLAAVACTLLFLAGCGSGDTVQETGSSTAPSSESAVSPESSDSEVTSNDSPAAPSNTKASEPAEPEPVKTDSVAPAPAKPVADASVPQPATVPESKPVSATSPASEPSPPTPNDDPAPPTIATPNAEASLEEQLAAFEIPPAWIADIRPKWSTSKPWKEGRKEIRRLLGTGSDADRREGIKLTWEYLQKGDIGDGHEYGMYMFLGSEPLWAVHAYREWLARPEHSYPPYFGVKALAALYTRYGLFADAEKVLNRGMTFKSPDPKWNEVREAELHDAFGDLYTAWGKTDQAKVSYQESVRLYPLGKPPYGRHLLPRKAKKVQSKLDLLSKASLEGASLRDGTFNETALGYSGDVHLTINIKAGRIADVRVVKHEEKIDQNACVLIPERIVSKHSLMVDGISGATVTKDAIIDGTLRALKKAGLK